MSEIAGGPGETPANKGRAPNDFLINRTNTPNIQASFAPRSRCGSVRWQI